MIVAARSRERAAQNPAYRPPAIFSITLRAVSALPNRSLTWRSSPRISCSRFHTHTILPTADYYFQALADHSRSPTANSFLGRRLPSMAELTVAVVKPIPTIPNENDAREHDCGNGGSLHDQPGSYRMGGNTESDRKYHGKKRSTPQFTVLPLGVQHWDAWILTTLVRKVNSGLLRGRCTVRARRAGGGSTLGMSVGCVTGGSFL
jgi:hypothetical protein